MMTSSVAERTDVMLTEHTRFIQGRGAAAPVWLRDLRARGADRFSTLGFPTVRDEDWRFTNVAPIASTPFRLAEKTPTNAAELTARVRIPEAVARIVVLNGQFAPELSSLDRLPRGVVAGSLGNAIAHNRAEILRRDATPGEPTAFVALNTAFFEDGAFIAIAANAQIEQPIHIVMISGGAGKTMAHPRTRIVAGAGSHASVVQTCLGAAGESHFTNIVNEISVGENAHVDLYTDQRETDTAYHVASTHIHLERHATLRSRAVTLGGKLVRNDIVATLAGEGAHVALDGCYLVDGDRLVDNHTTIDHATPHCTSHELYKGILDGRSRAVFNGRIIVREDAQKTDAKQTNRALLLSDEAVINSNPQLEIFADDVKCTHGAAIGQLNDEALFYLRARGLKERDARDMLIHAYAGEVLQKISIDSLRQQLERELFVQLERDLADHHR